MPRASLPERLARLEEAVARLEQAIMNHLQHLQRAVEAHEARLQQVEGHQNRSLGRSDAVRHLASLLVPALSGSVMALLVSRLLGGW